MMCRLSLKETFLISMRYLRINVVYIFINLLYIEIFLMCYFLFF